VHDNNIYFHHFLIPVNYILVQKFKSIIWYCDNNMYYYNFLIPINYISSIDKHNYFFVFNNQYGFRICKMFIFPFEILMNLILHIYFLL